MAFFSKSFHLKILARKTGLDIVFSLAGRLILILVFNSLLKDHMERNMFVNFELKNPSKQYILAQFWFDKINAYRK